MDHLQGFVALGRLAFDSVLTIYKNKGVKLASFIFKHGGVYKLDQGLPWLVASYHPSQQNTQTGRLTVEMFDQTWQLVKTMLA